MQIVIDISEEIKAIIDKNGTNEIVTETLWQAVKNGTPLPEHHGRLIDADAFIAMLENTSKRQNYKKLLIGEFLTVDDVFEAIIGSLQNKGLAENDTPTILEATEEVQE